MGMEIIKCGISRFNPAPQLRIPGGVAFGDKGVDRTVPDDGVGSLESGREGIHSKNVRMEEIPRLETLSSALRVPCPTGLNR